MKQKIKSLFIVMIVIVKFNPASGQATMASNHCTGGWFLGWDGTGSAGELQIRNDFSSVLANINFYTGGSKKATLLNNGNFGMSNSFPFFTPAHMLDIDGGDINVGSIFGNDQNGYMIGGNYVLRHKGAIQSIYLGVGAGNSSSGSYNTFAGYNAGSMIVGGENTFIGGEAGALSTTGVANTFIGKHAGKVSNGTYNTFVGAYAGLTNDIGDGNTFVGANAGHNQQPGAGGYTFNTYIGLDAGFSGVHAGTNVYVGTSAGYDNVDGNGNTMIGYFTGRHNKAGFNTFIGISAGNSTVGSSTLLLGTQNVFAGVNAGSSNVNGNYNACFGASSGINSENGNSNIFIGAYSGLPGPPGTYTVNNSTVIGANALVATDNTMILGNNDVSVGIGISGNTAVPSARLHVQRNLAAIPPALNPVSIYALNADISSLGPYNGLAAGVSAVVNGRNRSNVAFMGDASQAMSNYGGSFTAKGPTPLRNYGGYFEAQSATSANYAVYAAAPNTFGVNFNVAVYGSAPPNQPFPPNPAPAPGTGTWAGYFSGDLGYTGSFGQPSDSSLKREIKKLTGAGSILNKLTAYSYFYDEARCGKHLNFSSSLQFGIMAQELEAVAPNLVINSALPPDIDAEGKIVTPSKPVKMVNYIGIIPLLIQGYNEQQAAIDSLIQLVSANNAHCGAPATSSETGNHGRIELENIATLQLLQNDPNPFNESTMVRWNIPGDFGNALIYFYDSNGTKINSYKITLKGKGELQVFGSRLSSGVYTYTLVVDGKVIDSKKMVKSKL